MLHNFSKVCPVANGAGRLVPRGESVIFSKRQNACLRESSNISAQLKRCRSMSKVDESPCMRRVWPLSCRVSQRRGERVLLDWSRLRQKTFSADLSPETLNKTTFSSLNEGDCVNLEQPLTAGKEFGGHFVLGHVDGTGTVAAMDPEGDSWRYSVRVPPEMGKYVVLKGSITVDGISLTVANWEDQVAEIAVIPFTYEHTNIRDRHPGDAGKSRIRRFGKVHRAALGGSREPRGENAHLNARASFARVLVAYALLVRAPR